MKTVDGVVCMQCDNDSNILQATIKVYYYKVYSAE